MPDPIAVLARRAAMTTTAGALARMRVRVWLDRGDYYYRWVCLWCGTREGVRWPSLPAAHTAATGHARHCLPRRQETRWLPRGPEETR